ncbi:MAG: isoprenyl transferase [Bacteroidota bacterium]
MSLKDKLIKERLPRHVAIIMDGNGRWARKKGAARVFGHQNGVIPVREVVEASGELGIEYLTLYAFSTENWGRPAAEINALMSLLVSTINQETKALMENNVRLLTIGNLSLLPETPRNELAGLAELTKNNSGLKVVLALSYSSRAELVHAAKKIMTDCAAGKITPDQMNSELFETYLETAGIPDPELLIRTSGEFRISNFLLYQIAYTELYFTPKFWPDFRKEDLYAALLDYQGRERRFGKISEQL